MGYKQSMAKSGGLNSLPGVMVLNPGVPHSLEFATFEDNKPTIFRILPEMVNGQPVHGRLSNDDNDFSNWITVEKMIKKAGINEKITCCTRVKGDPDAESPIERFHRTISTAVAKSARSYPAEWESWLKGAQGRSAELPKVENNGFIQCVVYWARGAEVKDAKGAPSPRYPCVFSMTRSACWEMEKLMNSRAPTGEYVVGDFINEGRLFKVAKAASTGNQYERSHYAFEMVYDGAGNPIPVPMSLEVMKQWQPWDQVLRFLTAEEQILALCRAFPAEAVDFVFGSTQYAKFLPQGVLGAWGQLQARATQPLLAPAATPYVHPAYHVQGVPGTAAPVGHPQTTAVPIYQPSPVVNVMPPNVTAAPVAPVNTQPLPWEEEAAEPQPQVVQVPPTVQPAVVPLVAPMPSGLPAFDPAKAGMDLKSMTARLQEAAKRNVK